MFVGLVLAAAGGVAMLSTRERWAQPSENAVPVTGFRNEDSRPREDAGSAVVVSQPPALDHRERPAQPAEPVPVKTTRFHIVQQGETLASIAVRYYGSAAAFRKIVEANKGALANPDRIHPGMKLIIPD
ncbi:MAG TPA: LysM peptidoglycan-binding domain-containing protein [Sedimentisphaerales bacterium]|nr:LysM peptidoglycan-binding domain-containing protein [Sedimentisphaerales bacterium]